MKKSLQFAILSLLLCAIFVPVTTYAVNATKDSPVLFNVRGSATSGVIKYEVVVLDIYSQTYQSWTITYPSELTIQNTSALSSVWNISTQIGSPGGNSSASFILKSTQPSQTTSQMKTHLETIHFTLTTTDIFPPNSSKVAISAFPTKVTFFQDDRGYAHWYEFISWGSGSTQTWFQAYNSAKGRTMQDQRYPTDPSKTLKGYLATITSEAEQMQIYSAIATQCGWLGGTRVIKKTGSAKIQDDASISTTLTDFNTDIGTSDGYVWYWACGPEAWTIYNGGTGTYTCHQKNTLGTTPLVFFDKPSYNTGSPSHQGKSPLGIYNNFNNPNNFDSNKGSNPVNATNSYDHFFNSNAEFVGKLAATGGEPNNSSTEYCLQFAYNSGKKTLVIPAGQPNAGTYENSNPDTWNDFNLNPGSSVLGYYVEFGGYPDDPLVEELSGSNVTTSSEVELVLPVVIQYRSTVKNLLDNYQIITSVGTSRDSVLNYEQFLPYTAVRNQTAIPGYTVYGYDFIGQQEDRDNLTVNAAGNVSGFFSPYSQRIIFLFKPNDLTVYFDANFEGATNANVSATEKTIYYDSPYGTLPIATRMGYVFAGWFTGKSVGTIVEPETMVTTQSNHTLYAHWQEKNGYTVKYDENFATSGAIPDKTDVSWGADHLLPTEPTRTGYVFMGWNVSVNGSTQGVTDAHHFGELAFSDQITFITLQAQWASESEKWVVIYHTNGSTNPVSLPNDTLHSNLELIKMPVIAKAGYAFGGWDIENNGAGVSYPGPFSGLTFSSPEISNTEYFVILAAKWTSKTYTVNYKLNDGTSTFGTPRTGVLWEQIGLVPAPDGTPERTGYLFMGWNTLPDGDGKYVFAGDSYASLVNVDTKMDTTLYAQWMAERTYFVRYDLNGGSSSTPILDKTGVLLATSNLLPVEAIFPPLGFEFSSWAVSFNGTKQGVTNTDKFGELADDPNVGFIILQAQWSPKAGLTVQYFGNGGSWVLPAIAPANKINVVWTQTHLLPPVEPEKSGEVFVGWNTAPNGSGVIATNASTYGNLAQNDTTIKIIKLYAQWVSNTKYTVRYDVGIGLGSVPNDTLNAKTDAVKAPIPTAPSGYQFLHWKVEDNGYGQGTIMIADGTETFEDLAYPDAKYIVLLAEYNVKNSYTVIYHHNLPDTLIMDTLENVKWTGQNNFVPSPFPVSNPGFSLLGWTTEQGGTGITVLPAFTYNTLVGGVDIPKVILYAQWEVGSFTVRYDLNGGVPPDPSLYVQRTVGFDDSNLVPLSFARAGYVLTQWNISENGFGLNVKSTDRYRDLANTGVQYIIIQAQWGEKEYQVLYDENGSSDTYAPQTGVRWWSDIEYPPVNPTPPPGYDSFLGWKLSAIGTTHKTPAEIDDEDFLPSLIKFRDLAVTDEVSTTSITIQAQYHEKTNVTINYWVRTKNSTSPASGGTVSSASENLPPATGVAAGSIATPNPGYHFVGWFAVNDTVMYHPSQIITPSLEYIPLKVGGVNLDTTYVALFEENSNVTINYAPKTLGSLTDTDGGAVSPASESVAPATGNPSATATPNAGYHLVGWFYATNTGFTDTLAKTPNFNPPRNAEGIYVDTAYVALFAENPNVTITYEAQTVLGETSTQGGTVTPATQTAAPATGTPSATATPEPGYHLVGWYYATDLLHNNRLETDLTFEPPKIGGLNVDSAYVALFAENDSVTITYSAQTVLGTPTQGGTVSPASQKVAPATGTASGTASPEAGYYLVGWFYETDLSHLDTLSKSLNFTPDRIGGLHVDSAYVALFAENPNVTITYEAKTLGSANPIQGGSVSPANESVAPATGTATGSTAAPNTGYHLVGWFAALDVTYSNNLETDLSFIPSKIEGLNVDSAYVALFAENDSVTIKYSAQTVSGTSTQGGTVSPASEQVAPATGTASGTASPKAGYHLVGWFYETDLSHLDTLSKSLTFNPKKIGGLHVDSAYVALFAENPNVTITYEAKTLGSANPIQGGSVTPANESVAPATGTAAGSTATPEAGYHLVGWFSALDLSYTTNLGTALAFIPPQVGGLNVDSSYVALFAENDSVNINYAPMTLNGTPAQGGSVAPASEKVAPATGIAGGSTATPNAGYHLVGWFYATDDTYSTNLETGLSFTPSKFGGLHVDSKYVALFAENDSVTINYATITQNGTPLQGGSVSPTTQKAAPATSNPSATATLNAGYHLVGWFYATDGSYSNSLGTTLTFTPPKIGGLNVDSNYVAVFAENDSVTIYYTVATTNGLPPTMGGSVSPTSQKVAPASGTPSSTAIPNPGFNFVGWFYATDISFSNSLGSALAFNPPKIGGLNVDSSYVAQFTPKTGYIVVYDTDGGTPIPDKTVNWVDNVLPTTNPTKPNYIISGWEVIAGGPTDTLGITGNHSYGSSAYNDATPYIKLKAQWCIVTAPVIAATNNGIICSGTSVTLTVSNISIYTSSRYFKWYKISSPDDILLSTEDSYVVSTPGTYYVLVVDGVCWKNSLDIVIITGTDPEPPVLDVTNGGYICNNEDVAIYITNTADYSPYATYKWFATTAPATVLGTNSYLSVGKAGNYNVTVTDDYCSAIATTPIVVHHNPTLPVPNIAASDGGYLEPEGSITLSVSNKAAYSGSETYVWFDEKDPSTILSTTDVLTVTETGLYNVIVTDIYCTAQNKFLVCPLWVADYEGKHYSITSLAGFCWTSNMATRTYANGNPIAFAQPYYSTLYADTIANTNTFGLLYTWYSAVGLLEGYVGPDLPWTDFVQGICPLGWHIPTQQEWESLSQYNIRDLKSENYWIDLQGFDIYEFTSLPAGLFKHTTESFINLYGETAYWSCGIGPNDSSPYAAGFAYYCSLIIEKKESKSDGFSVRCIFDY